MRAARMPRTGRFKLDGEPQPQQAAVVMIPGKVARMTAYLGSTFPDQLIQERKAVQTGARVGFDAAQQREESHLVHVGESQFQVSTSPVQHAQA